MTSVAVLCVMSVRPTAKSRAVLYGGIAAIAVALVVGGYLMFSGKPQPQSAALQDLKVEQLEQILAERRKADAEAAEKRRIEDEARHKEAAEAAAKGQADSDLEKARLDRQKAELELAQLKARRKEEADQRKLADEDAARRKAEAELAALKATEQQAQQKAADEATSKRQADEALAKAEAERKQADAAAAARAQAEIDARAKADPETRQKAEAELAAATERKAAEAAEAALRLGQPDRQRLQVALTSLGFDTRGSDGAFGPRSREMIAAWQKARSLPSNGFLNGTQQQALLKEAAPAVARFDDEQKKADEEKKKVEEARKKAEEEARARAGAGASSPGPVPAATPAPAPERAAVADGLYTGGMTSPERNNSSGVSALLFITVEVSGGRGSGRMEAKSSANQVAPSPISFMISPDGGVSGSGTFTRPDSIVMKLEISGRAAGNAITLNFTGFSRPASVTLARAASQ